MANYSTLKAAVADVVKTNGTQAITGANLQAVLLSIINSVGGGGYIFEGVATPSTDAGTPDQNVFYIGGAGTYANFGTSVTVRNGEICVFKYNGSWANERIQVQDMVDIDAFPFVMSTSKATAYNGHLDGSGRIVNYGDAKHIVICVRGGDSFTITPRDGWSCMIAFVKTYDVTASLPYNLDFATGASCIGVTTTGTYTAPSDANYIIIRKNYNNGSNILPLNVVINGNYDISGTLWDGFGEIRNLLDEQAASIAQIPQKTLDRDAYTLVMSINNAMSFDGHLDSSGRIVEWGQAKHIVICVRGGDSFNIVPRDNNCAIAFLKTYEVGATLPYSLDYATGSSFIGVPSGGVYTAPSDAKYLVIRKDNNNGVNVLPLNLIINNSYDIAGTLWDEFGVIMSDFNKISEYYNGTIAKNVQKIPYLSNVTKTVVGVTVTCHADGTFDFVGTGTSNGGRTASLTGTFHLDAGTYKMRVSKKAPSSPSSIVYYLGETSVGEFNTQLEKDITISTTGDYFLGVNLKKDGVYNLTGQMIEIIATETSSTKVTAFDAVARDYINKMGIPVDFAQKDGIIKVNKVIPSITGYQGMCEIDGVLYSCGQGVIYVPKSGDTLFGTKAKNQGISVHNNDVDYCYITDTFITACVPDDNLPMALYLLMDAKSKLNSDTALTSSDWLQILMPSALDDEYIMVGNCFGERSDIVYCILIDKADNFSSSNKRILKLQLGVNSSGVYDGTYTILSNREWPYILEIQGSKYCNGKLYVGTDSYINTGSVLHAGITTIDVNNLITIEYPAYATLAEKSLRIESEGVAFIGDKIYQIVIDHTNSVRTLREYDRFNL